MRVVYEGKTTDQSFGKDPSSPQEDELADSKEQGSALLSELVYGTLRHYYELAERVDAHVQKPLRSKDLDLRCLLLVGAYQLLYLRIPDHAAINETVNACRGLKKPWARGLVNAVLRGIARERLEQVKSGRDPAAGIHPNKHSVEFPAWLAERLHAQYPAQYAGLAKATLERAPMVLRVNARKATSGQCLEALAAEGIRAGKGWLPETLILDQPVPVRNLPGYQSGTLSVQDAGAQFAAALLADGQPKRVLDACAAPGGKLFHLRERLPEAEIVGIERSETRYAHLEAEAARLGHETVTLRRADATGRDWATGDAVAPFDAILIDAPCSGTGTLRRHPDIRLLRKPEDLADYQRLQLDLLRNLWPMLSTEGTLLYCTCSLLAEENDDIIETFLEETAGAVRSRPIELPTGIKTRQGWQLLPLPAASVSEATTEQTEVAPTAPSWMPNRSVDGFYFARLTHREKAS